MSNKLSDCNLYIGEFDLVSLMIDEVTMLIKTTPIIPLTHLLLANFVFNRNN